MPNLSLDGITGTIHAVQGSIGGFELTKNYLQSVGKDAAGNRNLILNGTTGALKAHGTGDLAGGNIKWDSAGNVTFGPDVTLNWNKITNAPTIPEGVSDDYIKSVISDSYITDIISDDFIKATFKEAIETDFTTKITDKYITTQNINTLRLTTLGEVTAGSCSLGNNNFVVDSDGNLTAKDADITGKITATSGKFTGEVIATSGKFTGEVNATSGTFTGEVNALEGYIGGLTLEGGKLCVGDVDGNRIELDPYSKRIRLTNDAGQLMGDIYFEGGDTVDIGAAVEMNPFYQGVRRNSVRLGGVAGDVTMIGYNTSGAITERTSYRHDGMYVNGVKQDTGGGGGGSYAHPLTHSANMITEGTFSGIVKANNNTSYTTKQVRNIILSTGNANSSQMANGDI